MADRVVKAIITGDASGAVRAFNETAAASETTGKRTAGSFAQVGAASRQHIGGTSVQNAGLLEGAFKKIDTAVGSVLGSIARVATTSIGIGGAAALGGFLVSSISNAEKLNVAVEGYSNAIAQSGQAFPVAQYAAEQQAMEKIGIGAIATTDALTQMTQAHIPATEQMQTLQAAADLMAAKHLPDLASALELVEKAAQGQGRGLQALGLELPAAIPKAAALESAQKALAAAQDNYTAALKRYGPVAQQTADAHKKLADAQQKVTQMTDEMQSPFENLSQITQELEGRLGGAADAAANADPWERLKTEWETVTEKAGMLLLPKLDELAHWVEDHMPQIQQVTTSAFHDVGQAISVVGDIIGAVAPPAEAFIGWLGDHKETVKEVAEIVGGFYVANKAKSVFGNLYDDVQKLLGVVNKIPGIGGGGVPSIAPMHVWVDNMGAGGLGPSTTPGKTPSEAPQPKEGPSVAGLPLSVVGTASLGLLVPSDAGPQGMQTAIAQAQAAQNIQRTAQVSGDIAKLWETLKSYSGASFTDWQAGLRLTNDNIQGLTHITGDTGVFARDIEQMYQQHKLKSAPELQAVTDAWNKGAVDSSNMATYLDDWNGVTMKYGNLNATQQQEFTQLFQAGVTDVGAIATDMGVLNDYTAKYGPPSGQDMQTISGLLAMGVTDVDAIHNAVAGPKPAPGSVSSNLTTLASLLGGSVGAAQDLLNAIHSDTGAITGLVPASSPPPGGATGGKYPGLAGGGKVFRPGLHWVGEGLHNPEWVINNEQAGRFAPLLDALVFGGAPNDIGSPPTLSPLPSSPGAGAVINNYVTIQVQGGDPNAVVNALKQYMAANGTIPVTVNAARRLGPA